MTAPTLVEHPTLRDADLEAAFRRDGFVVLDGALTDDEVQAMRDVYFRFHPTPGRGFEGDIQTADPAERAALTDEVTPLGEAKVTEHLVDHRTFVGTFFMKWPDDDSALVIHRDWTYVDERRFRSVSFWMALDDASSALGNGPIQVLPGSHRYIDEYRGPHTPAWHWHCEDEIRRHLVDVDVRAGQVVVLDNALVHASGTNRSDRPRLALTFLAAPRQASLFHAVADGMDRIRLLRCDEDFFIDHTPDGLIADPPRTGLVAGLPRVRRSIVAPGLSLPERVTEEVGAVVAERPLGGSRPPEVGGSLVGRMVTRALALDHRAVRAAVGEPARAFVDADVLPWLADLEAAWPVVLEEWRAVAGPGASRLPRMRDVSGDDLQAGSRWSSWILRAQRTWIEPGCRPFPRTVAALSEVPDLRVAFFSVLDPGAEIAPHRGPTNGVLRAHLGVELEADEGDCVLRAGAEQRSFAPGRAFAFDDTFEHQAWNRSLAPRVSLMLEVLRPLPGPAGLVNRATQALIGLDPHHRGAARRADRLMRALND